MTAIDADAVSLSTPPVPAPESATLLEIADLEVSYRTRQGDVPAVRGVSLTVGAGEVVAVVGESGSGKTTVAQSIIGLLARNGRLTGGAIDLAGQSLIGLQDRQWRQVRGAQVGLVPQDPTVSLNPVKRVGAQVGEVLVAHGLADRRVAELETVELLTRAGLPDARHRARQYPHELSGGMRQRVLIAMAIAASPKLIIADEPTSALDVTVQRQILDHLGLLISQSGTAMLLITHDLSVAADRADRIVVMSQGEVVEAGPADQVLNDPQDAYTRRLLAAAPSRTAPVRTLPKVIPAAAESNAPAATDVLVAGHDLVKTYRLPGGASLNAVGGVSLQVRRGETLGVVGESGSGKSTLARLLLRLVDPTAGTITFDGQDITSLRGSRLRRFRSRAQLVYQNPYASLDPRQDVGDIVAEPLRVFRQGNRALRHQRAVDLLERVGLPASAAHRKPAELSGGQRQRVAIARALALTPDLVVCDEPVSALDVSVQAQVLDLLAGLQDEQGLTYLFITHDLAVVRQIAHRVAVMKSGQVVEQGTTADVFAGPQHPYTAALLEAIPGQHQRHTPGAA